MGRIRGSFWGSDSSISDDEDSINSSRDDLSDKEGVSPAGQKPAPFSDRFMDVDLYRAFDETHWESLGEMVQSYCDEVNFGSDAASQKQQIKKWIKKSLEEFPKPFDKARACLLIRQYIYSSVKDYGLEESGEQSVSDFLRSILPIRLLHHDVTRLGTVVVQYNKETVGYFKPGVERQQKDMFLANMAQHLFEQMEMPTSMPPIFASSVPSQVAFCDIELQSGTKIPKENDFHLSFRGPLNDSREKVISVAENMDGAIRSISGGMQRALLPWKPAFASSREHLVLLTFALLFCARDLKKDGIMRQQDLKSDGIMGQGTIIDFEDFLEKKQHNHQPLPDLHIPFHTKFSSQRPTRDDWDRLLEFWSKVDESALMKFVSAQDFAHRESMPVKNKDSNDCLCTSNVDERSDYVVAKPQFAGNAILSEEQKAYLQSNLPRLINAIKQCQTLGDAATIFDLIAAYDPLWNSEEFGYTLIDGAITIGEGSPLNETGREALTRSYDERDLRKISSSKDKEGSLSAFTGLYPCPKTKLVPPPSVIQTVLSTSPVSMRALAMSSDSLGRGSSSDEEIPPDERRFLTVSV